MPEIGVEHLSKDRRHEAVDEEVHGGVDDHEELRDDAPEERPHADAVAVVLHVLDELLYRENLRKGSVGTIAFDRKLAKPLINVADIRTFMVKIRMCLVYLVNVKGDPWDV